MTHRAPPWLSLALVLFASVTCRDALGEAALLATSDPAGSEVIVDGKLRCVTPCRLALPPGRHGVTFRLDGREDVKSEALLVEGEQVQLHGVLGERVPWKVVLPTFFVGGIFTAGGLSSILIHGEAGLGSVDAPADERRFHRNLGIASVAIGVPLLALSVYLAFTGRPGETRTSVAPGSGAVGVGPLLDHEGSLAGASLSLVWY